MTQEQIRELGNQCAFHDPYTAGLSKREYFAVRAMQSLISIGWPKANEINHTATIAIMCADALIAELNKEG